MALLDLNLQPSQRELRWFGILLLAFFGLIGGVVYWYSASILIASVLGGIGGFLCVTYYVVRPLRTPMYRGWIQATYPIGWVVSHGLLAIIYYLVLTPIGLIFRLLRRDALRRRGAEAES